MEKRQLFLRQEAIYDLFNFLSFILLVKKHKKIPQNFYLGPLRLKNKKHVSVNKHISYSTYGESLKGSSNGIVPNITKYSAHSSRSGGATVAANSSVKERTFQRHEKWKLYIKDPITSKLFVPRI